MSRETKKFYIFTLTNINLFPRTTKPLNIFEPRYIQMVHESIRTGVPVALCFLPEGGAEIRPVAGFAVPRIIEERADQTLLIFMSAEGKVQLEPHTLREEEGIACMDGAILPEEGLLSDECREMYVTLGEVLVRWVHQHVADPIQREIFIKSLIGPSEVAGAVAAYLVYDYDLQYELMELLSVNEQIKFLYRLLESGRLTNV